MKGFKMTLLGKGKVSKIVAGLLAAIVATTSITGSTYATEIIKISSDEVIESEILDLEDVENVISEEENEAVLEEEISETEEIVTESETYAAEPVAPAVTEIPGTISTEAEYDKSFNSVTGFASVDNAVKDRSEFLNTEAHVKVSNGSEFAEAVVQAKSGKVKVIELTDDIDLGWNKFTAAEQSKFKGAGVLSQYKAPSPNASIKAITELAGFTNEEMLNSGVSSFKISDINGLTIFSKNGYSISHAEINVNRNAVDIIIRNIHFKNMWMWDDDGNQKAVGWSDLKLNEGRNIWIDHCSFDAAFDGNIDIENGATGLSITWCKIGQTPEEATVSGNAIYNSIMTMENLYSEGKITTGLYKKFRDAGATPEEVMMYSAYHDKCHLCGSGDKDCIDYNDTIRDSNGNIRVTLAYNHYRSIGQRLPMIRQGSGHMFNCYIDDSLRSEILKNTAIARYATSNYKLSRCINARNGASIGADTCIFNGVEEPIIGAEYQKKDTGNMSAPWPTYFANAINHSLIVNSKVINSKGTYVGSSWDNNGVNNFTPKFTWVDKSTIGKWAWSNTITNYNDHKKGDFDKKEGSTYVVTPYNFEFAYDYDEMLPYSYNKVSLDDVENVIVNKSGVCAIDLSDEEWCKTIYYAPEEMKRKISSIGDVEYSDAFKNKIDAIFDYYAHLSEAEKAEITNIDTLNAAKEEYEKIDNVVKLIEEIGTIEYTTECKNKIDSARAAYNALSKESQAKVINNDTLVNAENRYKEIITKVVYFNANGGSVSINQIEVTLGKAYGNLPVPKRKKYEFEGWFTDSGMKIKGTDIVNIDPSLEGITLYAKWYKDIPETPYFEVEIIGDYEYTGNAIIPEISVTFGDIELHEGIDYTVAYKNNINAYEEEQYDRYGNINFSKAPTVIVTGKGKFTGKQNAYFLIEKADISKVVTITESATPCNYVYNTKNLKVVKPVFVYNKAKLTLNKDYKIELPDGVDFDKAESYEATIEALEKSNFKGSETFTVKKVDTEKKISSSINIPKQYYCGRDFRDYVTLYIAENLDLDPNKIKAGSETLKKGEIALIMPTEMVEPGTYSVTIISNGQVEGVTGSITKTLTIAKAEFGKVIKNYPEKNYSVNYTLEDLSVSGDVYNPAGVEAKIDSSKAKVVIQLHLDSEGKDEEYPVVKEGGLVEGRDYTVAYANNKKAGKASVTIKGKGNFAGIAGKYDYTIEKADLSEADVVIPSLTTYVKKGANYKPSKVIVDVDGCTVKSSEYTVKYYLDDPATEGARELGAKNPSTNKPYEFELADSDTYGVIYAQITAKELNYTGSIVKEYYVYRKASVKTNLSTAIVKAYYIDYDGEPIYDCRTNRPVEAKAFQYTGNEITTDTLEASETEPIKMFVTVKATKQEGSKKVTGNVDITDYVDIVLTNNVNVGTATAVVSLKDGAAGIVTLTDRNTEKEFDVDLSTVNGAKLQNIKIAPYNVSVYWECS